MKEHWQKIKEYWANLAPREKQAVSVGGIVLGIFVIYQFIWSPMIDRVRFLRAQIQNQQTTLMWMQATDKKIQQMESYSKGGNAHFSPVLLLSALQKNINQAGLAPQLILIKQTANNLIALRFQKVEFDKLIKLLTRVVKEQQVAISQLSVNTENIPGIVNAEVTIKFT